jgi:thioredoxin reductase (NADPH)
VNSEQFRRLAAYGQAEHAVPGRDLFTTGDSSYDLFLIETAAVEIVRDHRVIFRAGPGDFLGELSLLTGQHVYLTGRVISAGTVIRVGADMLRRALAEHADLADLLIETFRQRREVIRTTAGSALRLVGRPDTALTLRTYLAQLLLPHTWQDTFPGLTADDLPAAVIDGMVLRRATPGAVAEALGLTYRPDHRKVDLVVVGAGPAGLAAAVYAASEGLSTVLLDRGGIGGQAAKTARIENYLGFPHGVSGDELTRLAMLQALKFNVRIHSPCTATALDLTDPGRPVVVLDGGARIRCRAVIAATGADYRRLDIPGWAAFERTGCIRYAATEPDVRDYQNRPVTVLGGANSAGQAALSLAAHNATVNLIVRGARLETRMSTYLIDRIRAHPRIHLHLERTVDALVGGDTLSGVVTSRSETLDSHALFCFIGATPETAWLAGVTRDDSGFVVTPGPLPFQTSSPRVFAVGDLRSGSTKRVATAVGDGAAAVSSVHTVLAAQLPATTG